MARAEIDLVYNLKIRVGCQAGAPAEIFSGGGQAMYLLSTGSHKTLRLQPGFCLGA